MNRYSRRPLASATRWALVLLTGLVFWQAITFAFALWG